MADTSQPFVFVLMPFDKKFEDVYKLAIKPACEKAGAYAERVDDQIFQESILQRIYSQIAKADIIIADMTGRNPNVFYETGYAHALGKQVILLTNKTEDIPFDLKHYYHIIYEESISNLIPEIEKRVLWMIQNPEKRLFSQEQLQFYIGGVSLSSNPLINSQIVSSDNPSMTGFELQVDVYNSPESTVQTANFQIGFFTSAKIAHIYIGGKIITKINPPNGGFVHIYDNKFSILPGAWESKACIFSASRDSFSQNDEDEIVLRVFSENVPKEFPFRIKFIKVP
jgi:hypothetical protein